MKWKRIILKVRTLKHWGCRETVCAAIGNNVVFVMHAPAHATLSLGLAVVSDVAPG